MHEIGKILKKARQSKGVTIEDVEETTKIRRFYIESLENNEFDNLPGKVYALGFLKRYVEYLELPQDEIIEKFKQHMSWEDEKIEENLKATQEKKFSFKTQRTLKKRYFLLIAVVIFAGLFFFMFFPSDADRDLGYYENNNGLLEDINDNDTSYSNNNTEYNFDTEDVEYNFEDEGVNIELIVFRASCWIGVEVDGEQTYQGTLNEGQSIEFEGEEDITITFGNAGAVRVIVNGEERGAVGELNEVKTVSFP